MEYQTNSFEAEHVKIRLTYSAVEIRLEDGRLIRLNLPVLLGLLRQKLGIEL